VKRIDLKGKPIVISGASSGIGAATAHACAAAGMPVLLFARREDKLRAVAAAIRDDGGSAELFAGDVTDASACEKALRACRDAFGGVYAAFANAGYGFEKSFLQTTDAEWRAIIDANFFGTVNLLRPAVREMAERGEGHALVCSSCIAKFAVPYYSAYCASKAAQWPIAHALFGELRNAGVHATAVHPIGTKTEFFEKSRERTGAEERMSDNTPGFLMQDARVVARAIVRALERPRLEVWPGVAGRMTALGAGLVTAFPWIASRSLIAMASKRTR
jgi:short-subunit dehydrogenase